MQDIRGRKGKKYKGTNTRTLRRVGQRNESNIELLNKIFVEEKGEGERGGGGWRKELTDPCAQGGPAQ